MAPTAKIPRKPNGKAYESKRHLATFLPNLLTEVKLAMVAQWRRGVAIPVLAKMYEVSRAEAEAVIHEALATKVVVFPGQGSNGGVVPIRRAA